MQRKFCLEMMAVLGVLMVGLVTPGAWAASKYNVLYDFQGGKNGAGPNGALIPDAAGNLYGVTATGGDGGNGGCGTAFELSPVKDGWAQKVIYRFPSSAKDGCLPSGNLIFDVKGNLYGTTSAGGQGDCFGRKCGTVFELTPIAGDRWKETVLHRFAGGNEGSDPSGGLVLDAVGNAYGSTESGGGSCDCGTVFELTPLSGGGWAETILHTFSGSDGASPGSLTFDTAGNLYGVASYDGEFNAGVLFELTLGSEGTWNEITLYNFQGAPDGALPDGGLTFDGGSLYGATDVGGAGYGTIFEVRHSGNGGWTESVIYRFTGGKDGQDPIGSLAFDKAGNLYGSSGGDVSCLKGNRRGCGGVFALMPSSDGQWKHRVLYTFAGGSDPAFPSGLMSDANGHLYGDTGQGGAGTCKGGGWSGCGVVFEINP